jgi:hypothetical protein
VAEQPPASKRPRRLAVLSVFISIAVLAVAVSLLAVPVQFYRAIFAPITQPTPQDIYKARLGRDIQSLDRGLFLYSPINTLKTGASTQFDVVVRDIGKGPQSTVVTEVDGLLVYQQDVPTGGIVGVAVAVCGNLICDSESSSTQPVLFPGDAATWRWQIIAGAPGPAEIILRADTYDQGSQQTLSEEIIPITGMVVPTPTFNQQQSHRKVANIAKSGVNLIITIGSIATSIITVGGLFGWLVIKKRQRKLAKKSPASRTPKRKTVSRSQTRGARRR